MKLKSAQNFFIFLCADTELYLLSCFPKCNGNSVQDLRILLTSDDTHKQVFNNIPIIGFKDNENLKTHLVHFVLLMPDKEGGLVSATGMSVKFVT